MSPEIQDIARDRIPLPRELIAIRKHLGLTKHQLSEALGFGPNGHKTVHSWEDGTRDGDPFKPTATAWAALRYLLMVVETLKAFGPDHPATAKMRRLLPECLK